MKCGSYDTLYMSQNVFYRPGVAGAVLQRPVWLIHSLTDPLWTYLQQTYTPKLQDLESWHLEWRFTYPLTCHVSCVTCHVLRVTCHMSGVRCHVSLFFFFSSSFFTKLWSYSVEGLSSTGLTPSSLYSEYYLLLCITLPQWQPCNYLFEHLLRLFR